MNHQSLIPTLSALLTKIRGSRTALLVNAVNDPAIQEILDETHQLEAKIVLYLDKQMDTIAGEDTPE